MRAALAVLLFLAATCAAADPVTVPAGHFADLKTDAPKGTSVVWRVYPPPAQRAPDLAPGRLIFAGKAGTTYTVTAITIDFAKQTTAEKDFEVTFAGKGPPPGPDPKPDPDPNPDPKPFPVGTLYLAVVHEAADRTPELAAAINDLTFWGGVNKRDVKWRVYDKDSPDLVKLGYLPDATKVGLPAALVYDKAGKLLTGRRIAGKADIDATLKEVGR